MVDSWILVNSTLLSNNLLYSVSIQGLHLHLLHSQGQVPVEVSQEQVVQGHLEDIPEEKDKIRIKVQVWRDAYESYLMLENSH